MKYVVGFALNDSEVLLIRKARPEIQKGLLNGVGGKIETWESSHEAMVREFREETGADTEIGMWRMFCEMVFPQATIFFFIYCLDIVVTPGEYSRGEPVAWYDVVDVLAGRCLTLRNIPWLLGLALDADHFTAKVIGEARYANSQKLPDGAG